MLRFHLRKSIIAVSATLCVSGLLMMSSASAEVLDQGTDAFSYGPEESACGAPLVQQGSLSGRHVLVARGEDGVAYYSETVKFSDTETNSITGEYVRIEGLYAGRDLKITYDTDGASSVVVQFTGTTVIYDATGNVLARRAGINRLRFSFDAEGDFVSREELLVAGNDWNYCGVVEAAIGQVM